MALWEVAKAFRVMLFYLALSLCKKPSNEWIRKSVSVNPNLRGFWQKQKPKTLTAQSALSYLRAPTTTFGHHNRDSRQT